MSSLFTIRQGDTLPAFTATVLNPDGTPDDLTGKTVKFIVRAGSATTPVVNAAMSVVSAAAGTVSYAWSATDTATAGMYVAEIRVTTTASGATYTFPNQGYIDLEIAESLTSANQQIVSVAEAKDALNMDPLNRVHDSKVDRWISAVQVVVENIVGPVIIRTFDEWYAGGSPSIVLRHRPSTALGTDPLLILMAASEYLGPIEWPLSIVASPDEGQTYSVMLDKPTGTVTRRTAGGGVQAFAGGPDAVHLVYSSGQDTIPPNIQEGTLETLRVSYQDAAQALRRSSSARAATAAEPTPYALRSNAMMFLNPNRKFPSLA